MADRCFRCGGKVYAGRCRSCQFWQRECVECYTPFTAPRKDTIYCKTVICVSARRRRSFKESLDRQSVDSDPTIQNDEKTCPSTTLTEQYDLDTGSPYLNGAIPTDPDFFEEGLYPLEPRQKEAYRQRWDWPTVCTNVGPPEDRPREACRCFDCWWALMEPIDYAATSRM